MSADAGNNDLQNVEC